MASRTTLTKNYAHALLSILEGATESETSEAIDRFVFLLKKRGHERLLPHIQREYENSLLEGKERAAKVTLAHEADKEHFKAEIKEALAHLESDTHETIIDKRVVGGFRVEGDGLLYDKTHRKNLSLLFKKLISS